MAPVAPADSGFSLIELLVALALSSFVVIGLGGLIYMGANARERVQRTEQIENALIDLRGIAGRLSQHPPALISRAGAAGFSIEASGVAEPFASVTLAGKDLTFHDRSTKETSTLELVAFEKITLEYLHLSQTQYRWDRSTVPPIAAARLRLDAAHRSWPVLLWVVSPRLIDGLGQS